MARRHERRNCQGGPEQAALARGAQPGFPAPRRRGAGDAIRQAEPGKPDESRVGTVHQGQDGEPRAEPWPIRAAGVALDAQASRSDEPRQLLEALLAAATQDRFAAGRDGDNCQRHSHRQFCRAIPQPRDVQKTHVRQGGCDGASHTNGAESSSVVDVVHRDCQDDSGRLRVPDARPCQSSSTQEAARPSRTRSSVIPRPRPGDESRLASHTHDREQAQRPF